MLAVAVAGLVAARLAARRRCHRHARRCLRIGLLAEDTGVQRLQAREVKPQPLPVRLRLALGVGNCDRRSFWRRTTKRAPMRGIELPLSDACAVKLVVAGERVHALRPIEVLEANAAHRLLGFRPCHLLLDALEVPLRGLLLTLALALEARAALLQRPAAGSHAVGHPRKYKEDAEDHGHEGTLDVRAALATCADANSDQDDNHEQGDRQPNIDAPFPWDRLPHQDVVDLQGALEHRVVPTLGLHQVHGVGDDAVRLLVGDDLARRGRCHDDGRAVVDADEIDDSVGAARVADRPSLSQVLSVNEAGFDNVGADHVVGAHAIDNYDRHLSPVIHAVGALDGRLLPDGRHHVKDLDLPIVAKVAVRVAKPALGEDPALFEVLHRVRNGGDWRAHRDLPRFPVRQRHVPRLWPATGAARNSGGEQRLALGPTTVEGPVVARGINGMVSCHGRRMLALSSGLRASRHHRDSTCDVVGRVGDGEQRDALYTPP
mmetsp:Transcript_31526/g.86826  ORF Transcript_31526/g.86826 Transcript_31526/m.86826 type:complete len:489 (+) Transcript_31526:769-2235(+)